MTEPMLRVKDPHKLYLQLRKLQARWGGAQTPGIVPPTLARVEAFLHDICHVVTLQLRFAPQSFYSFEAYINASVRRLPPHRRTQNEIHTLAAELHVMHALGVTTKARRAFVQDVADTLAHGGERSRRRIEQRVYRRAYSLAGRRDAKRALVLIRRHQMRLPAAAGFCGASSLSS